jgi:REP-associated tyrosine transposase
MARAKRHYLPGHIFHITHRCHKKDFLLKFAKDRNRWLQWLYQAKTRYDFKILNYIVTSNHIHLLVVDDGDRNVIPKSMQLTAGRACQEFNQRKKRNGAFWEDRYHATAIEKGDHFFQCCAYIDLNMVHAGVVEHPLQWPFSGYNEIQNPRKKNILIDYEKFMELLGTDNYEHARQDHFGWAADLLGNGHSQGDKWTRSIAIGRKEFVEMVKTKLGVLAKGRKATETDAGYQLREPGNSCSGHFDAQKGDIVPENT